MKRHGEILSPGMWSVVVVVFGPNNGRDYGLAHRFGQPACSFPDRRLDGQSLGFSRAPLTWSGGPVERGSVSSNRVRPSRQTGERSMSTPSTRRANAATVSFGTGPAAAGSTPPAPAPGRSPCADWPAGRNAESAGNPWAAHATESGG